jgi:magnesium transporter
MQRIIAYHGDNTQTTAVCLAILTVLFMIERFKHGSHVWIDLYNPTAEEAREAMIEAHIPLSLMSDITTPTPRSSVSFVENTIKLMIDYPVVKRTDIERPHDIKFFVTKQALVTAHYEDITAFHTWKKEFEMYELLGKTDRMHGGLLFAGLMNVLYDALTKKLDYLDTQLESIEHEIFNEREKEMVLEISKVSRKLIAFKQALVAHGDVTHDARPHFIKLFGTKFEPQLRQLDDLYEHIMRRLSALTESASELRETNHALVSTKEGEVMKTLTIMAFVTFPLTLFSSLFGINSSHMPIMGQKYDFWIIVGIMTTIALSFFLYFRYKRWF